MTIAVKVVEQKNAQRIPSTVIQVAMITSATWLDK